MSTKGTVRLSIIRRPKPKIDSERLKISLQQSIYMEDLFWLSERQPKYGYHLSWKPIFIKDSLLGLVVGEDA